MTNQGTQSWRRTGFTVVELLIVILVIAIITSIAIISYRGIQNRAHDVAVINDLENFSATMAGNTYRDGVPLIWDATPGVPSYLPLETLDWSVSKKSYNTSVERNLVFCYNYPLIAEIHADWGTPINGRNDWAMVSKSMSGAVFYVTNKQLAPQKYTGSTPMVFDSTELICGVVISQLGAAGFTSVYHGYFRDDLTTGPWRTWVD
ncbi:MAG: prepilin-type N-terminal cleavage/methylation domain-containing protein [Patescibacteria group bacterium]